MADGIKEALYCLFRQKSNKANIPASQVDFIRFLEDQAPELILEKKEHYTDKITEQYVPISATIKIPSQKELKVVTPLTLAILFMIEGKYHTDRGISFNYDTIISLLELEPLFSDELKDVNIFTTNFTKFAEPEGFWALNADGAYNLLNAIRNVEIAALYILNIEGGKLPIASNTFEVGINTTRMILDHPHFYFEHPTYLDFKVTIQDFIDYRTAMVCDHYATYSIIKDIVLEKFGSGTINLVNYPELRWRPTTELCAIYLHDILASKIPDIITQITVTEVNLPTSAKISSTIDFNSDDNTGFIKNSAKKVGQMYDE